jgi:hypothetical protein
MLIAAGQLRVIQNQTINENVENNGTLTLENCVVNGNITGVGRLKTKGNVTLNGNVTQASL